MDISIKNLKKHVFEPKTESLRLKRATDIVGQNMVVTEKVDGTKLTLVRTNETDPNDYTKNWIVAYKGTVLYPKEFAYIGDKEKEGITQASVGISQYVLVFDHLKKINNRVQSIPKSTEFSVEFAQNKDTLTRTYVNKGGMFLRSYSKVAYRVVGGGLYTRPEQEITEYSEVEKMAKLLQISPFPIFHSGDLSRESLMNNPLLAPKLSSVNWANPLDVLEKFSDAILSIESSLGGKTEGVVMKLDNGEFYKVVQADQYDLDVRGEKKAQYKLEPEAATAYFQQIRALIQKVFVEIDASKKSEEDVISDTNFYIAQNEKKLSKFFDALAKIVGGKKSKVQIMDDIHDTVRLIVGKEKTLGRDTKTLGLIPIAGKPLHIGHWKLIEKAAAENDNVVVYTSLSDRVKKGEFPIYGEDFITIWSDILIPALPNNVKVKFVDSPVRSVMHELGWLEQSMSQDAADVPAAKLYSDKDDVDVNFKDEDLKKFPTLLGANKIEKVGVERTSTVNISGTKMREFLANDDKATFMRYLPPVSNSNKEEIWNILIKRKPLQENPYRKFVEEVINELAKEMLGEGGWRNPDTQEWEVTPKIVAKIVNSMDQFLSEFNAWSGLPELKTKGPTGSGKYYKDDLNNPDAVYGDVDMQMVLPVESNERKDQLEANKAFGNKIREFITTKKPSYIHDGASDPDFGIGYLVFNVDGKKIQVDLVLSYTVSEDWTSTRTTPQKGLKGFVTGMVLSSLADTLNVVLGSSTNPYINTLNGNVVSSAVKKNVTQVFLKPSEVFADIVRFYGKKAGVNNVDVSPLTGYMSLDANDPSLKKKLETVVALANALEKNGIFKSGVISSKDGEAINSRKQFIDRVRDTYIDMMERAKTAKKLEKAQTPSAMKTVEKIKKDADLGTELAKQILKEHYTLLVESGKSIAAVDPKTPKMVNGQPAQANVKLRILDPVGRDIHAGVSKDIKDMVYALNEKVGFWKKNNPYIENGFIFNGSSQFLMDPKKFGVLSKYKDSFGDIDIIIPKTMLSPLKSFLDGIDDNKAEWTMTSANKLTDAFYYIGRTKSYAAIPDQVVTLWYYAPIKQVVQIDFEGDDMFIDDQGYEKPSEWTKFSKDSPWEDLTRGIKGLAGALMLRSLARATTVLDNAVVLTPKSVEKVESGAVTELTDKEITKAAQHAIPSAYTLNTGGGGTGIRRAYEFVKKMPYRGEMVNAYKFVEAKDTAPEDRITDVSEIFEILFGKKATPEERAEFRSYQGLLRLMKKYLDKKTIGVAMGRFTEILAGEGLSPKEYDAIKTATQDILGISI